MDDMVRQAVLSVMGESRCELVEMMLDILDDKSSSEAKAAITELVQEAANEERVQT